MSNRLLPAAGILAAGAGLWVAKQGGHGAAFAFGTEEYLRRVQELASHPMVVAGNLTPSGR